MTLPIANGSGATMITTELREAIESGTYGHGQRLPAERDLAAHYGSSRTIVREALGRLETEGLLVRKVGSGTFVNRPTASFVGNVADITSPLELMEVREAVEPHLARLAVVHASAKDLQQLEKALVELEICDGDRSIFSSADEAFHMALAKATGNPLMVCIYRQINDVRCHEQWVEMKQKILDLETIAIYNRQHRDIFDAIRKRDADRAAELVMTHLDQARKHLVGAG